jgi:hypothetical protein
MPNADYYRRNKELVQDKWAIYRKLHPEVIKAGSLRYYASNKEAISIKRKLSDIRLKQDTFSAYGDRCAICGESSHEFLCIDHIDNNGMEEHATIGGGVHLYRHLQKLGYPKDGYRLLCYNCNMARMLERKMSVPQVPRQVRYTRKAKTEVIDAYGGKCVCCGEDNSLLLVVDHVNGGGQADRVEKGRGRAMYVRLKAMGYPKDGYRLLCHNCNMSLGFFGYCPHGGLDKAVLQEQAVCPEMVSG